MSKKAQSKRPGIANPPVELRRRAETRLRGQRPADEDRESEAGIMRLLHEMEIHQVELEIQNAELQGARDELEKSLEKYTDLYDFAPVGYLTLDLEGVIREANLAVASLLRIARSALVGQRFGRLVSASDRPAFEAFLKKVIASGAKDECEVRLLDDRHSVDVRMEAILFKSGKACRVAIVDITQRKLAEAATAQLAAIVKSSNDAIIGKDLNGIITSWNQAAERIFGYAASEMVGTSILRLIPADRHEEENQILASIRRGETMKPLETLRRTKDGRLIEVSVTASPIKNATGQIVGVSKVARDITERKRAETDRLILNKLESTGILAGGIAHDFNNLLTVVLLNVELAQMLDPSNQDVARHLADAKRTALLARGLTAQLVTFAEGGAPIRKATLLADLIRESARTALSGSKVRCEFSLAEDLWAAEVDAGQFGQVIRNLVLNAREAMPQGGVVSLRAENVVLSAHEPPALPPGEYVCVSIADHGVGIAKDVLPKIFDPYFSTKQRGEQKGMGLGLTICHSVVQKHGGAMAVESTLGVGTTFRIYLPAFRKLAVEPAVASRAATLGQHRILVMDDDAVVRTVVGLSLKRMGQEVELVKDGRTAIEIYNQAKALGRPFDLVILDLVVPAGMGGLETLQELRRLDPSVKAVVMSGYSEDPAVIEFARFGFKAALAKPFDHDNLQGVLARVMGKVW